MRNISILEEQLLDEFFRCERNLRVQKEELDNSIKGYISVKHINGKERYYLQYKENGKVVSKYIKEKDLESIRKQIENRNRWRESVRELKRNMHQLQKALGRSLIDEYRPSYSK